MHFARPLFAIAATVLTLTVASGTAQAQVTSFTDRPDFLTALGAPVTVEDFGPSAALFVGNTLNSSSVYPELPGGVIDPGVTYSIADGNFTIDGSGGFAGGFLDGPKFGRWAANAPLVTTFDSAVRGFGFVTNALAGISLTVDVFGAGFSRSFSFDVSGFDMQFFGFVAEEGITSASISGSEDGRFAFAVDDFTFGGVPSQSVPEPMTASLLAVGMLAIVARARRRGQQPR